MSGWGGASLIWAAIINMFGKKEFFRKLLSRYRGVFQNLKIYFLNVIDFGISAAGMGKCYCTLRVGDYFQPWVVLRSCSTKHMNVSTVTASIQSDKTQSCVPNRTIHSKQETWTVMRLTVSKTIWMDVQNNLIPFCLAFGLFKFIIISCCQLVLISFIYFSLIIGLSIIFCLTSSSMLT